jgi:hypothetical protein
MIVTVLTCIGIGIALLVLVLLIIPIRIFARGSVVDHMGFDYQLIIDWAFGVFSVRAAGGRPASLYIIGLRICHIPTKIGKKKKSPKKSKPEKPSPLTWLKRIRGSFPQINRILSRFGRACFLRGSLSGKIGLADPADTAFIGLLSRLLQIHTERFHLSLTTVYEYQILQIRAQMQSTLIIGYLGFVALGLLLDKQVRVLLRGLFQTNYKEDSV